MVQATTDAELNKDENLITATRLALVVEYDGTSYYGFQLQASHPTIQGKLEKALNDLVGENIRISAASRTDAGVHARGQVISFKTSANLPLVAFVHGLNYYLPPDIAVTSAHKVPLAFDVRRMAVSREYTYSILNSETRSPLTARFAHRIAGEPDIEAMNRACRLIIGTHDFASFASDIGGEPEQSTVRHVHLAEVTRKNGLVVLTIVANAFLRHQVRSLAGALIQVGLGKMSLDEFEVVFEAKQPGLAGLALPACGLTLVRVNYPCSFEEMK